MRGPPHSKSGTKRRKRASLLPSSVGPAVPCEPCAPLGGAHGPVRRSPWLAIVFRRRRLGEKANQLWAFPTATTAAAASAEAVVSQWASQ